MFNAIKLYIEKKYSLNFKYQETRLKLVTWQRICLNNKLTNEQLSVIINNGQRHFQIRTEFNFTNRVALRALKMKRHLDPIQ